MTTIISFIVVIGILIGLFLIQRHGTAGIGLISASMVWLINAWHDTEPVHWLIGRPVANMQLYILDAHYRLVPVGERTGQSELADAVPSGSRTGPVRSTYC